MKIKLLGLTVRELVDGYHDDGQDGVRGYGGKLDIRPPFQREFIYGAKERNAVIDSILNGFPLNVMYWSDRGDGTYEIIDGQQRTISIAQYVAEKPGFSFEGLGFDNQQSDIKEKILNYELMVYVCSGTDSEKLAWFKVINIAGVSCPIRNCATRFTLDAGYPTPSAISAEEAARPRASAPITCAVRRYDKNIWKRQSSGLAKITLKNI